MFPVPLQAGQNETVQLMQHHWYDFVMLVTPVVLILRLIRESKFIKLHMEIQNILYSQALLKKEL